MSLVLIADKGVYICESLLHKSPLTFHLMALKCAIYYNMINEEYS